MKMILLGVIIVIVPILILILSRKKKDADKIDEVSIERSGRVDINSQDFLFDLKSIKTSGTRGTKSYFAHWLDSENQKKYWVIEGTVIDKWDNFIIEFVPEGTGYVIIQLRGSCFDDIKNLNHDIWVDKCEVEGSDLKNGDFEIVGSDGSPAYWGPKIPPKRYSRDGKQAYSGKSCVLVCHDRPIINKFEVEEGKKYTISVWFKAYKKK